MRLSEAIRLGSLAIECPKRGDARYCAIGMAVESIGKRNLVSETDNYNVLQREWPWTSRPQMLSGFLKYPMDFLWQTFDGQVSLGLMTLEALCNQVRAWEDELAAKGINVEQVTMAAELNQPASQVAENIPELEKVNG